MILTYTNKTGGVTTDYRFDLSGDNTDISSSTAKLEFTFPSEFSLVTQSLTCVSLIGFSSNPSCSITGSNVMEISMATYNFPFSELILNIIQLKNPLVEKGPFVYTLRTVG